MSPKCSFDILTLWCIRYPTYTEYTHDTLVFSYDKRKHNEAELYPYRRPAVIAYTWLYTLCPKKRATLLVIISSYLNRFSKRLSLLEGLLNLLQKNYIKLSTTPKMCCRTPSRKLNVQICCIFCTLYCVPIKGNYQTHRDNFTTF